MSVKTVIERFPVLSYVALAYAVSWTVWFAVSSIAGHEWALLKIWMSVGLGPGLAAVLLDRMRGTAGAIDARWWLRFAIVACCAAGLGVWTLVAPDARTVAELRAAHSAGVTPIGIAGVIAMALVCAFIYASAAAGGTPVLRSVTRWRMPLHWWLTALCLPAALLAIAWIFERTPAPQMPLGYTVRSVLFTAVIVGIGEEVGWRGWMLPALQRRFSPLVASILLGIVWGFWHFPLFLTGVYPGGPESILVYVCIGPIFATLLTWMFNRTGGSVLLAIALHTAINNSSRFLPETSLYPVLLIVFVVGLVIVDRM